MAALSKQNYKWIIVITFLGIIFVPGLMPAAIFKTIALVVFGGICLLFEFLYLKDIPANAPKSEKSQTILLIFLTIVLLGLNFII
jgi:hypothetical protein